MIKLKNILVEGTRCWKGYTKKGMKTLFGKRVPNCVKNEADLQSKLSRGHKPDWYQLNTSEFIPFDEVQGGLGKWFKEKWVDVSRKTKSGKHPECGASAGKKSRAGGKRAYPKCVKASKARSMSKKDKESATRRKRKAYSGKGKPAKSPKMINTDPKESLLREINKLIEKNIPTDKGKWTYAKGQAKKKFKVYPSAYANAWAAKKYKELGGTWRKG